MFISHLLSVKKINKHMSSYQILRVFLQFLGKQSTSDFSLQLHALSRRQVMRIKRIINRHRIKHGFSWNFKMFINFKLLGDVVASLILGSGRRGDVMVSGLISRSSSLGSSPGRRLGKTLYSCCVFLHPGV